ncbi:MAG TPA: MFS transporter [Acidimicrobiia bacterium]|nr:MFS transporter [Acidimicrobiia bacterium]HTC82095.1 MFS transporter [Acidimicrobiia bacterium]
MIALLRRNGDFRAVFVAQIISFAGDWFATVAMLGLVIDRTGSKVAATAVFVVQTLPSFALSPLAGPAADRFDRRRLMVTVSVLQAGAAGLFLVAVHGPVAFAFLGQGLIAGLGTFFAPASQAALPNLVDADDLPLATVMMSSTWGAMLALGAAIGGLFALAFGRDAAFVADGASFLIAAALIASVRRPTQLAAPERRPGRMRPLADTVETFRYARTNPVVAALLGSKLGFGLGGGAVGMLALLATGPFHSGDGGTGLLLAARGLGVVAGPFAARRFLTRRMVGSHTRELHQPLPSHTRELHQPPPSHTRELHQPPPSHNGGILLACGVAGLVYGAGYLVVGTAPVLGVAAAGALLAHLGGGAQWTLSTYGLQAAVPDYIRGRVFAADFALVTVTMSLSLMASGALAEVTGPRPPTLVLAGVSCLWGVAYLTLTRPLRRAGGVGAISSAASTP